jgi:hypothetical protein
MPSMHRMVGGRKTRTYVAMAALDTTVPTLASRGCEIRSYADDSSLGIGDDNVIPLFQHRVVIDLPRQQQPIYA